MRKWICAFVVACFSMILWGQDQTPTITDLTPSKGGVGDSVTIKGSNFGKSQGSSTVTFNKKAAKITSWSDSSIVAVVPGDATTGDVVITVDGKSSAGKTFTLPTIESISPDSAAVGELVTIKINGFDPTKSSPTVTFNGNPVKSPILNSDSIIAVVPAGATGDVVVIVGGKRSAGKAFAVKPPEYDKSAFEVLTGVGGVLAGVEATSYKTNNDTLSATNVGRKTIEILLGGAFTLPWRGGGGWIEREYCGSAADRQMARDKGQKISDDCQAGGAYDRYRPWVTFLSIRFAPASDQVINGFVLGGGYRITKYFSVMFGYSVTPVSEPSPGFRVAAAQTVLANSTVFPYNRYNASDLSNNKPGAFDGFPLFLYNASGVTTTKIFPNDPTVTHYRSGIYFGVGIPLNLTALFKPSAGK